MSIEKVVAYYRVSTAKQGSSGLGLEAQRETVSGYLRGNNRHLITELVEIESGKKTDRPKLTEALALCRVHNATLLIAKLDRLARNVNFISNLMESGVEFTAVDLPQANRLTIHILAAVAEHEAAIISARTKAALAVAKARGTRLGNPTAQIAHSASKGARVSIEVRRAKALKRSADLLPIICKMKSSGKTSLRSLALALNQQGITAPRGGMWSPLQVQRVLRLNS